MKGLVLVLRMLFQAYRTALPAADKHQRAALPASTLPLEFASASLPATIDVMLAYGNAEDATAPSHGSGRGDGTRTDGGHDADRGRQDNTRETDDAAILATDVELSSLP